MREICWAPDWLFSLFNRVFACVCQLELVAGCTIRMLRFSNRNTPLCLSVRLFWQPVWAAANGVSQRQHWVCASAASILRQHLHPSPPPLLFSPSLSPFSVFVFLVQLQKCKAKTDKQNAKQKWCKETAISFVWLRFLTMPPSPSYLSPHTLWPPFGC